MQERKASACGALLLAAVACAVSCSRGQTPAQAAPAAQPAAAPEPAQAARPAATPPAAAPAASSVIASETFSDDAGLRCDLLEVKRVSGGAVRIKWRMVNTSTKAAYYNFGWGELYFVDPAENKKYGFLMDTGGQGILDVYYGTFQPGDQKTQWAKFPAPPAGSTKITVHIPKVTPFEDVPVSP